MALDPNNPTVRLCAEGIQAESAGERQRAAQLYGEAWNARGGDLDACIAAHYLARVQTTAEQAFEWNRSAVQFADAVGGSEVVELYPSLYLNLGKSHEDLGQVEEARKFYEKAEQVVGVFGEGKYADVVRRGIAEALKRVGSGDST